jgi:hypothetical protein
MSARLDRTREWARMGAGARLMEIEGERSAILKAFPELRNGAARFMAGAGVYKRRKLSAAARRKLSAGMRKYWAKRKAKASAASKN